MQDNPDVGLEASPRLAGFRRSRWMAFLGVAALTPLAAAVHLVHADADGQAYSVSSAADVLKIMHSAKGGEIIRLEPGKYSGLQINKAHFARPVTITSARPDQPAELMGFGMADSSGVTLRDVTLNSTGSSDKYFAFRIYDCENITFADLDVHGDLAAPPGDQLMGFYIAKSKKISITGSRFRHLNAGVVANNNSDFDISHNTFTHLNKGGVEMGGDSQVTITENRFSDFDLSQDTHADAIQFYTAGTHTSTEDLTISGNLILRGRGDPIQGILLGEEVGTLPYRNLTIVDNAVIGSMWNAIRVAHADASLVVRDNIVASWRGRDNVPPAGSGNPAHTFTNFLGMIFVGGDLSTAKVTETGNLAQGYTGAAKQTGTPSGSRLMGPVYDEGRALVRTWIKRRARGELGVNCDGAAGCVLTN